VTAARSEQTTATTTAEVEAGRNDEAAESAAATAGVTPCARCLPPAARSMLSRRLLSNSPRPAQGGLLSMFHLPEAHH
jgi:hypothetical protein